MDKELKWYGKLDNISGQFFIKPDDSDCFIKVIEADHVVRAFDNCLSYLKMCVMDNGATWSRAVQCGYRRYLKMGEIEDLDFVFDKLAGMDGSHVGYLYIGDNRHLFFGLLAGRVDNGGLI